MRLLELNRQGRPGGFSDDARGHYISCTQSAGPEAEVIGSHYRRILADGRGRALYLFTSDRSQGPGPRQTAPRPRRTSSVGPHGSSCQAAVGIVNGRSHGEELQGHRRSPPLYYYQGDRSPGEVNCQAAVEFGGYWYVLRSNGKAVK